MENFTKESSSWSIGLGWDYEDLSGRGAYRLGRVHRLHPQIQQGREVVKRVTIAVLGKTSGDLEYILRDLAKIAPV